jgi:hypothetical protein
MVEQAEVPLVARGDQHGKALQEEVDLTPLQTVLMAMVVAAVVALAPIIAVVAMVEMAAAAASSWKWSIKMRYLIVEGNKISNIIESNADFAESIGAVPEYLGAVIGQAYAPPTEPDPLATLAEAVADLMYENDKKSIGG